MELLAARLLGLLDDFRCVHRGGTRVAEILPTLKHPKQNAMTVLQAETLYWSK
jgi:hypothetical protein